MAALTPTRRAIHGRSHLTTRPPWLAPSAETDFAPLGRGLTRPSPSFRSWSSGARERHLTTTCRPCPPPGPPREAFLALSARPGAMPDTVARRLRCRIASAPPPKRRLHPPEGGRRALVNRQDPSIALDVFPPPPAQRSAGDTVQCPVRRLTFRKTHEHSAPRLPTRWPPPEGDDDPAPGSPRAATHVRTRPARHDREPEDSHGPESPACATGDADRRAEAHRSANRDSDRPHG